MVFPNFLRIATLPRTGVSSKNESALMDPELYDYIEFMFIKMLSQALRFSYKLVLPDDGEMGRPGDGGNWTGLVGMVQRGEADFFIRRLAITLERSEVVDFSFPYYLDRIVFVKKPLEGTEHNFAFLKPFSSGVWIVFLACSFVAATVHFSLFKRKKSKDLYKRQQVSKDFFKMQPSEKNAIKMKHSKKDFFKRRHSRKGLLGLKLPKKYSKNFSNKNNSFIHFSVNYSSSNGEYILRLSWIVSTAFLGWCYTAVVLSFLTFPSLTGIRDIYELSAAVQHGKYVCVSLPGSYIAGALMKSGGAFRIVGNSVKNTKGSGNFEEVLKQTGYSKPTAVIATEVNVNHLKEKYFVSEESFFEVLYSVGIKKHFCCIKQLNVVINCISATGLYLKLLNDMKYKETFKIIHRPPFYDDIKQGPIPLEDLKGAFILIAVGYLLATVTLALEFLLHRLTS